MSEIAVIAPVLDRPHHAQPLADSLAATASGARLVFVCSPTDDAEIAACRATGADVLLSWWEPGHADFARKVNAAYALTSEPWLFQAADDVRFQPGWAEALLACHAATGAFVVGTDDEGNPTVRAGRHSTHTLIARSYVDEPGASMDGPGTVFSTAYGHQFCDTELVEVAKDRGVWAFCRDAKVTHDHPFWQGRARDLDATYTKGMASARQDARLFAQRRQMWARGSVAARA